MAADIEALQSMLTPDLTHTHTRGVTDNRESFLHFVRHDIRFLAVNRQDLAVRLVGTVAIITGNQFNHIQICGMAEPMVSRSTALQVWTWQDGTWWLKAFQSTNLPIEAIDPHSSYV